MGQACCSYGPKDANHKSFDDKTIERRNPKLYLLEADRQLQANQLASKNLSKVILIQAFARGCHDRATYGRVGKNKFRNGKKKS